MCTDDLSTPWADDLLREKSPAWLVDFISDNPSPTVEMAMYCSDESLGQFLKVILMGCEQDDRETAEELLDAAISGLAIRCSHGGNRENVVMALLDALRTRGGPS
jgi:hypothetical protein